jgi:hypothetical protein
MKTKKGTVMKILIASVLAFTVTACGSASSGGASCSTNPTTKWGSNYSEYALGMSGCAFAISRASDNCEISGTRSESFKEMGQVVLTIDKVGAHCPAGVPGHTVCSYDTHGSDKAFDLKCSELGINTFFVKSL